MSTVLYLVTGAPGSGKTAALTALLRQSPPFLVFDIDWLTIPASRLAQRDIIFDTTTWPAYHALWWTILESVYRNGQRAVFFSPLAPGDIPHIVPPAWYDDVAWLLLDCADGTRRARLEQRLAWTTAMIAEAIRDAQGLRAQIEAQVSTDHDTPDAIAHAILQWVEHTERGTA
jgi:hypothetical protein